MLHYKTPDGTIRAVGEESDPEGDQSFIVEKNWILITDAELDLALTPTQETLLGVFKSQVLGALNNSDSVALRCIKAGVPFPKEWQDYVKNLRALLNATVPLTLPVQPSYPAGT